MNISLPYYLLLLISSNGKCRLISRREQHAVLMDQQWHMCSCASLVSRCVSLSLLPRCPSEPSFVSIVVVPSVRHAKKSNRNILHCRPVCLTYPRQPLAATSSPQLEWALLCLHETVCVSSRTRLSLTRFILGERERGLYLEALILFSHLIYKRVAPLALFLMILNLWRDPGPFCNWRASAVSFSHAAFF